MDNNELTHLDETGKAHMVDISLKTQTLRIAIAKGEVKLSPATLNLVVKGQMKKGDVLTVAQLAGIMAAKKTSDLIPLCHPISINQIVVDLEVDNHLPGILIKAEIRTFDRTGAEMEALTAVSVACLTIYDMIKAVQKDARIMNIRLVEKHGGKSGDIFNE
jgi:cyclic pyranopterin monophosphate synthase